MKHLIVTTALAATIAGSGAQASSAVSSLTPDAATLADSRNLESLEKLYADPVRVDYTSAFGGQVEQKTPEALMTTWAGLLPGFERTHHEISNVQSKSVSKMRQRQPT